MFGEKNDKSTKTKKMRANTIYRGNNYNYKHNFGKGKNFKNSLNFVISQVKFFSLLISSVFYLVIIRLAGFANTFDVNCFFSQSFYKFFATACYLKFLIYFCFTLTRVTRTTFVCFNGEYMT